MRPHAFLALPATVGDDRGFSVLAGDRGDSGR